MNHVTHFANTTRRFGLLFILALFILAPIGLWAQEEIERYSGGRTYMVAYPDTTEQREDPRFEQSSPERFYFYIYSPVSQIVKVSRIGGGQQNILVEAGVVRQFDTREITVPIITTANSSLNSNILLFEGDFPFVMIAYMNTRFGTTAYAPLPVSRWGKEYIAHSWPSTVLKEYVPEPGERLAAPNELKAAPAEILVIAAYDSTFVTIAPQSPLLNCTTCTSFMLNRGESYLVKANVSVNARTDSTQGDLGGSRIVASKPIGVMSGNSRTDPGAPTDYPNSYANTPKDLAVTWLRPTVMHGKIVLFLPTLDHIGPTATDVGLKGLRTEEFVRYYAPPASGPAMVRDEKIDVKESVPSPALALISTSPISAFQSPGTHLWVPQTSNPNATTEYASAGTYLVEMIPKEMWGSFAPFVAPPLEGGYAMVNVVTDETNRDRIILNRSDSLSAPFLFNHGTIQGTKMIWGSMAIDTGVSYSLEGKDGARFGGFVFGGKDGYERFTSHTSTPSEYEQQNAKMYGYPLLSRYCIPGSAAPWDVSFNEGCASTEVTLKAHDTTSRSLASVRLLTDPDSTYNARIEAVSPTNLQQLQGSELRTIVVRIVAIDPQKPARGTIEFFDKSCDINLRRVSTTFNTPDVRSSRDTNNFDLVEVAKVSDEMKACLVNNEGSDITISKLALVGTQSPFTIRRTEPAFNWSSGGESVTIRPGDSLCIWVTVTPPKAEELYTDRIRATLGCGTSYISLRASTRQPCLSVEDIDFGRVELNSSVVRPVRICNIGSGTISFQDLTGSGGGAYATIESPDRGFSISPAEIERLKKTTLGEFECVTINVIFSPKGITGTYNSTLHIWSSSSGCDPTGDIVAQSVSTGPTLSSIDMKERRVTASNSCTKNTVEEYLATGTISNQQSYPILIDSLRSTLPAIYMVKDFPFGTLQPGESKTFDLSFRPLVQQTYSGLVHIYYTINGDSLSQGVVDMYVEGTGTESCVAIDDLYFRTEYVGATATRARKEFRITATGTSPTTITSLQLSGPDAGSFQDLVEVATGLPPVLPITIPPGVSRDYSLIFAPTTDQQNIWNAELSIDGDFAYVDCPGSCSDSVAMIVGELGTSSVEDRSEVAGEEMLLSVLPNPLTGASEIRYRIEESGATTIEVYNGNGQLLSRLLDEVIAAGEHRLRWDASGLPSGVYLITIRSGERSESRVVQVVR